MFSIILWRLFNGDEISCISHEKYHEFKWNNLVRNATYFMTTVMQ